MKTKSNRAAESVQPIKQAQPERDTEKIKTEFRFEEAFYDGLDEHLNLGQAIRSVGFLLRFESDFGNQPVDAIAALGLGHVLDHIASKTDSAQDRFRARKTAVRS